jgi:hypothetical protein
VATIRRLHVYANEGFMRDNAGDEPIRVREVEVKGWCLGRTRDEWTAVGCRRELPGARSNPYGVLRQRPTFQSVRVQKLPSVVLENESRLPLAFLRAQPGLASRAHGFVVDIFEDSDIQVDTKREVAGHRCSIISPGLFRRAGAEHRGHPN